MLSVVTLAPTLGDWRLETRVKSPEPETEDRGLREEKAATVTQIMKRDKNKTSSPASLK